jgi:hypothetical protein
VKFIFDIVLATARKLDSNVPPFVSLRVRDRIRVRVRV